MRNSVVTIRSREFLLFAFEIEFSGENLFPTHLFVINSRRPIIFTDFPTNFHTFFHFFRLLQFARVSFYFLVLELSSFAQYLFPIHLFVILFRRLGIFTDFSINFHPFFDFFFIFCNFLPHIFVLIVFFTGLRTKNTSTR